MEQNTKNALFDALNNESAQYYNVLFAGYRQFTNKETQKVSHIYNFIFADFKNETASVQTFYLDEPKDISKIGFLTPCVIGVDVKPGNKYSTLLSIEPSKK